MAYPTFCQKNSVLALLKNKYVILSTTTKSQSQNFVSYKTIKKIVMVEPENSTDIKKVIVCKLYTHLLGHFSFKWRKKSK